MICAELYQNSFAKFTFYLIDRNAPYCIDISIFQFILWANPVFANKVYWKKSHEKLVWVP